MRRVLLIFGATVFLTLTLGTVSAQTITLTLTSDPSGIALFGNGTNTVLMNFGSVQAFGGTVPAGVTKSVNTGAGNWTLSTPFDAVVSTTTLSPSYTLTAQLFFADPVRTWQINGISVIGATPTTITTNGLYGTRAYTLSLTIPFSAPAGFIGNAVFITVIEN